MLLRIGVENFRSIRDHAELSLVASDGIKDKGVALLQVPGSKLHALPFIVLYGANAAGKSSMHQALGAMSWHVERSFVGRNPDAKIPRTPFALDVACQEKPTRFECDFVLDNVRYHYGFTFTDVAYIEEWLFSFPEGYRRTLFERTTDRVSFGATLKGRNKLIEDLMRPNALFLSTAAQNSHKQLTPIYSFFSKNLVGMGATYSRPTIEKMLTETIDQRVLSFLKNADTGIKDARVKKTPRDDEFKKIFQSLKTAIEANSGKDVALPEEPDDETLVTFGHQASGGQLVELPFDDESRGTKRLTQILLLAFLVLDNGGVLSIDELDASLHTLLSIKLLELFADPVINTKGAQLIATTHDTNILCSKSVRRDQIWFAEKDEAGATAVYPLTDIRTRNTDNLERGYLEGRYGAVPFLGSIEDLLEVSLNAQS